MTRELLHTGELDLEPERGELRRLRAQVQSLREQAMRVARLAIPLAVRAEVRQIGGERCAYCGQPGANGRGPDGRSWHIDHVRPVVDGGTNDLDNLVLACASCNLRKHARSVDEFMRLLTPSDLAGTS